MFFFYLSDWSFLKRKKKGAFQSVIFHSRLAIPEAKKNMQEAGGIVHSKNLFQLLYTGLVLSPKMEMEEINESKLTSLLLFRNSLLHHNVC